MLKYYIGYPGTITMVLGQRPHLSNAFYPSFLMYYEPFINYGVGTATIGGQNVLDPSWRVTLFPTPPRGEGSNCF